MSENVNDSMSIDDIEAIVEERVKQAMVSRETAAIVVDPYEAMRRQRIADQQLAKDLQMDYAPHGGVYRIGAQWMDANGNPVQHNGNNNMNDEDTATRRNRRK